MSRKPRIAAPLSRLAPLITDQRRGGKDELVGALLEGVVAAIERDPRGASLLALDPPGPSFRAARSVPVGTEITRVTRGGRRPLRRKLNEPQGGKGAGR
jgi:hypothetical protein